MRPSEVIAKLNHLIDEGARIVEDERFIEGHYEFDIELEEPYWVRAYYELPEDVQPRYTEWRLSCDYVLGLIFGANSHFYREFKASDRVADQVAVLKSALDELESEFVRPLVVADVFQDILAQAEELLQAGYKDAAAVVSRVALELTLRDIAERRLDEARGIKAKAATLNQSLWKAGVYPKPMWRQVAAWLDIGNAAAHGQFDQYDATQVKGMIDGIRVFLETIT